MRTLAYWPRRLALMAGILGLALAPRLSAQDTVEDIVNYLRYSPLLASSGQPTAAQLGAVADDGVQRVVYLAFTDHETSLPKEDRIARDLGLRFYQLPVIWEAPGVEDFRAFVALLQGSPNDKTLVHCQINWRASSFVFLYRVIVDNVPIDDAYLDMAQVWTPNATWQQFMADVLKAYDRPSECELCEGWQH